jgi:hypothetical protein
MYTTFSVPVFVSTSKLQRPKLLFADTCWHPRAPDFRVSMHNASLENTKQDTRTSPQVKFELFEKYEATIRDYRGPRGEPQSTALRMHRNSDLAVYYANG